MHANNEDFTGDVAPTLEAFARDGQDKEAAKAVFKFLNEELEPSNAIEKMRVWDIATLTTRAAELRLVQVAVHKVLMEQVTKVAASPSPSKVGDTKLPGALAPVAEQLRARVLGEGPGLQERLVAMTYAQNFALFESLIKLESHLRAERQRVLEHFDKRRREDTNKMLHEVLDALG